MTVYQNLNQFKQGPIKGDIANMPAANVISCQVIGNSSNTLYAGTAVKLVDGASQTILVEKAAATDDILGFIVFNPKKDSFVAADKVEVALPGCIMNMETNVAIARGNEVEIVASGDKIAQAAGTNKIVGVALDKATASGQLIRVFIRTTFEYSSSSSSSSCRSSSSSSSSSSS